MKVAICDKMEKSAIEELKKLGVEVADLSSLPKEELPAHLGDADIVIVRSATKVKGPVLEALKNCKLILRGGVGLDNIDVEGAKAKGIKVDNTPEAASASVAELALGLMFALARHIVRGTVGIKNGLWEKKELEGWELGGKVLGILGYGRIGQELAKRAKALGMNVIAYRRHEFQDEYAKRVTLDELYAQSDFISIHLPLTPETKYFVNKESFDKMKDGVFIINVARGGVVDEKALLEALKSGKVRGAALDVFEVEPPENPLQNELIQHPNVICTPHIGASTFEGQARVGMALVQKVKDFLEGKL
jgi:D-3-phosphoglycerate dehydrogenase|uniref:3-phosphoglycerate dehydrogenase n=1 Tax=candidate division WOR-3 bacterium TaxID=2052148 RepID=A0A7V3NUZ0_UNCW3